MSTRAPTVAASFRNQAWLLGASGRWIYLGLGMLMLLMLIGISGLPPEALRTMIAALLGLLAGTIWAVIVWLGEGPARRTYHWSLPVYRPAHDLARVAVGAVYLLFVCAALIGAGAALDAANGVAAGIRQITTDAWVNTFTAPLTAYLLVSALVLWSDYRITRWLLVGAVAVCMLGVILQWQGITLITRGVEAVLGSGSAGLATGLMGGMLPDTRGERWELAAAVWGVLGVGVVLFTAAFRPDDLRRLVRGKQRS